MEYALPMEFVDYGHFSEKIESLNIKTGWVIRLTSTGALFTIIEDEDFVNIIEATYANNKDNLYLVHDHLGIAAVNHLTDVCIAIYKIIGVSVRSGSVLLNLLETGTSPTSIH